MDGERLDFLKRLARAMAAQFGGNLEIIVCKKYPDSNGEFVVETVENGHISGQKEGSVISLRSIPNGDFGAAEDRLSHIAGTKDGRVLKSSAVFTKNAEGEADGLIIMNFDITELSVAANALNGMVSAAKAQPEPERMAVNVNDLLDELIQKSVDLVGKPVALMNKDDKVRAITYLKEAGAFLITRSGDKVSGYFGISKYTLYSYLDLK